MKKIIEPTLIFAKQIAEAAAKIKAIDVKILDLRKVTSFTDYFVIASGTSDRHVEAIADSIELELKKEGQRPIGVEGHGHSQWIVVDFGDVVAHVFYQPVRGIYALEKLWGDAKTVRFAGEKKKPALKKKSSAKKASKAKKPKGKTKK